jgi:phosphatidylglycerol---prolipoprotein diacylglyceryl transferase
VHPTLFHIGGLTVASYPFFQVLAFTVAALVILFLARRQGLPLNETAAFLLFGIAAAAAGGKLYVWIEAIIEGLAHGRPLSSVLGPIPSGHSYYGGLMAVIPFSFWYLRRFHLPLWKTADLLAVGTALGYAIARIGCFLAGCCYGTPSTLPWAVNFPGHSSAVHPTQLYEAAANILNFLVLGFVLKRKKFDGQVIALDAMINSGARFLIEFFRGDPGRTFLFPRRPLPASLTITHLFGALGFAAGLIAWRILRKHPLAHER